MEKKLTSFNGSIKEKLIIIIMISSVFMGIYLALNSWLLMQETEWQNNRKDQRILQTETLATNANCDYFISRKILPLLRVICEDNNLDIKATRENYLTKYGLDFAIYKFDKNNLVETAPENAPNKWLMKNLFPTLLEKDIKKIESKKKELDKKIEFVFGYGKNLYSLQNNQEIIIKTVLSGKDSFAAWKGNNGKGVIIISNGYPDKEKVLKEEISQLKALPNQIYAGRLKENDLQSSADSLPNYAYRSFAVNSKDYGYFDNKEWHFVITKDNEKFYTAYELSNSIYYKSMIYFKILFFIIILSTIFIILNYPNSSILNLKKLVTLIFIASSILPLTIVGTSSLEGIDTLISINQNELKSSIEKAIDNIIQNFGNHLIISSEELQKLTEPPSGGFKDVESIANMANKIRDKFPNARVIARNASAELIYTNNVSFSEGQEILFKSVCNRYIEKYIPDRYKKADYTGNPFSDALVRREDLAFNYICNYPEQLQFIRISGFPIFLFVRTYEEKYGDVAIIEIQPKIKSTLKEYTRNINLRNLVAKQQTIKLAVFNPTDFKWYVPPKHFPKQFFEQAKTAYVLNKPIFRKIIKNNKEIYSLCLPNTNYEDICYLGYLTTDLFKEKINQIKDYVLIGAIVSIILLILIISWLMKQIIDPLSNLETGITALSEHKYEVKIPVPSGKDELVTLFKEFNFMMGENYDMQMAKNVQEGLITTKFPSAEGYYINGFSIPASDLGGDCLTSLQLADGKILFLVGDLTGNSIGSALMMSFVRSVTFNWSQNPKDSPASLADSIDQMLRDNKMKHMFMGIVCGILDPQSGTINFITRGHIYPLFIRNNGLLEWLGQPALPLGIGKKHITQEQSTVLQPGERILCISDGIIEIHKGKGLTIPYQQIEEWAKESTSTDNQLWLKSIEEKFKHWCEANSATQTDDITLFTITRNG